MESFVAPKVAVCSTRNRLAKIMKSNNPSLRRRYRSTIVLATLWAGISVLAGPPGPTPQVPVGGGAPGPFPNTRVTGVNVVAKGSTTYNGNVEITGYEGNGPIPWTVTKYNRGDIAMRLAPANAAAADANTLNKGFTDFTTPTDASVAEAQSWRPNPVLGVAIPTARQNGPVDWGDGEGPLYPTVAISGASSGPGYSMTDGSFGTGQLDINLGRAGTHSSPEANFGFSVVWFPYDEGWIAGNIGNPILGDPNLYLPDGTATWDGAGQHSAGLSPGIMTWYIPPSPPGDGATYGGLGLLSLPGVDAETNGMLFATSSQGNSDVNIVGVAPTNDLTTGASGWIVTIREDSALTSDEAAVGQSQFEFVYIPYNAQNLTGGYINGTTGGSIRSAGSFTMARTGTGTYELTVPGKSGTNGTLLLQVADFEAGASMPMASRAFLSYQYNPGTGRFVIQCRRATTDTVSDLADANFYFTWVDFQNPLSPPEGPRFRNLDAVAVTDFNTISPSMANVAVNTDEPEILVTTVDTLNSGGYVDPTTGNTAVHVVIGYFYDPRTLTKTRGPFFIMGNGSLNGSGQINKHDVKYNPVSHQYDVVCLARQYSADAQHVLMIARVNPNSVAGTNEPLAGVFTYDGIADGTSYDDVSIAVSPKNGNFIVAAEHNVPEGSGNEAAYGALFGPTGTVLTPAPTRLDLLQPAGAPPAGDVDDPDIIYLPNEDAFLFFSNTSKPGGITNHIVGSVIQTTASGGSLQVSGPEQSLSTGTGTQGHPAAMENPFNGELITAFDFGNGTAQGNLSFYNIGAGPTYTFTEARPEIPYLNGAAPNPFRHQHPRLAADPNSGVILVAHQAYGSGVGLPNAYVFSAYDSNGAKMASQLSTPYFLADSYGAIGTGANDHNFVYDPQSDSFIAVFTSPAPVLTPTPGAFPRTYLASVSVTSSHLAVPPTLTIARSGNDVVIRWPASATGYVLKSTPSLTSPSWTGPAGGTPQPDGDFLKVTITAPTGNSFYRLEK